MARTPISDALAGDIIQLRRYDADEIRLAISELETALEHPNVPWSITDPLKGALRALRGEMARRAAQYGDGPFPSN